MLARLYGGQGIERTKRPPSPRTFKIVARKLRQQLATGVRVKTVRGKNRIEIEFKDEDDLERIFLTISEHAAPSQISAQAPPQASAQTYTITTAKGEETEKPSKEEVRL
jgi:ParB family chromosome partitioning protein